jgi:hypothetical protein
MKFLEMQSYLADGFTQSKFLSYMVERTFKNNAL